MKDDQWILAHADELKAELLRRAKAGKSKPKSGTLLGRALALFTTPIIENSKLHSLLQTISDTCPMIEDEATKLNNGQGDENSLTYIEQLVHELAEAVSVATGNAAPGYEEGYEDGRDEGYEQGYEEGESQADDE